MVHIIICVDSTNIRECTRNSFPILSFWSRRKHEKSDFGTFDILIFFATTSNPIMKVKYANNISHETLKVHFSDF